MPTITFPLSDLRRLAGRPELGLAEVGELCLLVKGELKERASSEDEVKVELQDTNRPDTWCVEGIARQVRQRGGQPGDYGFLEAGGAAAGTIEVDPSVAAVRPWVAGFVARGYAVDDEGLKAFISAQEVLSKNFGRQRQTVAIGIYDAARIRFPVRYLAVRADDPARAFVPLAPGGDPAEVRDGAGAPLDPARWERPWTPAEVLRDHPTGREYARALPDPALAPLLVDAGGEVLSFPPIINSRALGRVTPGMDHLFVEVTGTVLDQVLLSLNILAANLADRGATIEPVVTVYPTDTPRGRELRGPHPLPERRTVEVELARLRGLLGEPELATDEVKRWLAAFGLGVTPAGAERLRVTAPAYRQDYLHEVDAIEDFAIARGYEALRPLLPADFTVGGLAPETEFADRVREAFIACGFEEGIGNILTRPADLRDAMGLPAEGAPATCVHGGELVRIRNVMNRNYAVLRDWVLPTLLEVEAHSTGAIYPHRLFEVGEVARHEPGENLRSRTEEHVAALLVHDRAALSELQGLVHQALVALGLPLRGAAGGGPGYDLLARDHPSFIPGRATWIRLHGADGAVEEVGVLGELHPEVLERWKVYFPAVACELRLDPLRSALPS